LNLDFKVAVAGSNSPEPVIQEGTLFVLNGDGRMQGAVQVTPSASPAAATVPAQASAQEPQGSVALTGQASPANLPPAATSQAPAQTFSQVFTTERTSAPVAQPAAAAPSQTAQAAGSVQLPAAAAIQASALVTAAAVPLQGSAVAKPSGESPKAADMVEASTSAPSGQSSALENSAGFQALKRGSQEDAPQPGLSFGQETLRHLASQVTKELGIRDAAFKQVSDAIADAGAESSRLVIKLKPANLGEVQVELSVEGGKVTAKLLASTPEVRDAFVRDLPAFKANLEAQGLRIDQVSVAVSGGSSSSTQGQNQGQAQNQNWGLTRGQGQTASPAPNVLSMGAWTSATLSDQRFSALA